MIDQSHNLKGKIEAMIQTVCVAQELYAKAALVDRDAVAAAQRRADLVAAESMLQDAFATDVRPAIREWRLATLPADPLEAFRESGCISSASRPSGPPATRHPLRPTRSACALLRGRRLALCLFLDRLQEPGVHRIPRGAQPAAY